MPEYSLEGFKKFVGHLVAPDGEPMRLYPEQLVMLKDFFEGTQETLIIIPKKNGKTTLLAALALFHLACVRDCECFIVASSRDQGKILYRFARSLVRRSGTIVGAEQKKTWELAGHKYRVLTGTYEIQSVDDDGFLRVLAADENTADGVAPTLALVDELHRHKTTELYTVLRDGLGPRNGQMITISTAGDSEESPLGQLRGNAHALPGMTHDGAYRFVNHDGFCLHEWALEEGDDIDNMEVVKTANPAPWHTLEALRARRQRPSTKIWEWKRFACGIWTYGEDSAIGEREWRLCARPEIRIPDGVEGVHIGLDIGRRVDTTALVAAYRADPDEATIVEPLAIIKPPGDGTATPEDEIWEPILEAMDRWPRATLVADPNLGGDLFMERLDREYPNALQVLFEQTTAPLALMAQRLSDAIAGGLIHHPDDGELNRHVLAGAVKPVGEKWRFAKPNKQKGAKIDALIAMAMAYTVLIDGSSEEGVVIFA